MGTYVPTPVCLDAVEVPAELLPLSERIAEHVHDVWAQQRIKDGWTYGPSRDDVTMHHPCLVPYGELPDAEKAYDRKTAEGTIKLVLASGFDIVAKAEG